MISINSKLALKKYINSGDTPYLTVMIFSLLAFLALTAAIIFNLGHICSLDNLIVRNFNSIALKRPAEPAYFITNLGSVYWILPITLFIAVGLVLFKRFREVLYFFMIDVGAGFLTLTLKWLIGRSRPVLNSSLTHVDWYSFPSGHTTLATCFYGALIYLALIYIKDKFLKISVITLLTVIILLVGISRVYLGAHFPTDVLAGFCIGTFWTALCSFVYKKTVKL